jgi:hypothetical protein
VDLREAVHELRRELAAKLRRQMRPQAGDPAVPCGRLGHAVGESIDQRRIRQVLAIGVAPENRRHGHRAFDGLDELELAQAAGLDDRFRGLHAQHHRRLLASLAGTVPVQHERHLQFGSAA